MKRITRFRKQHTAAWTPFRRATVPPEQIAAVQRQFHLSDAEVQKYLVGEYWINNRYHVHIRRVTSEQGKAMSVLWLSIHNHAKTPIHDWRDLQRIKNELVGEECEGVELYPAASRLVDTANEFHLFVITDPTFRFPFGFQDGLVIEHPGGTARQRPFAQEQTHDT